MAHPIQQRKGEPLRQGDILVVVREYSQLTCIHPDLILCPDDFDARSPDELTLRKAERVQLVELDEGFGDGWYLGRHLSREATGLFPGGEYYLLN